MNKSWFKEYLEANTPDINWKNDQMERVSGLLSEIAKANGGIIFKDIDISTEDQRRYALQRTEDALGRRFNAYANTVREQTPDFVYNQPMEKENDTMTTLHEWQPMFNLNTASSEQLERLPAIGPVLAQRIVEYRNMNGAFKKVAHIEQVKGIDDGVIAQTADRLFVMPESFKAQYHSSALETFVSQPNLTTYSQLLLSGGAFSYAPHAPSDPPDQLIGELSSILDELQQNAYTPYKHLPMTRGSRVRENEEIGKGTMDPESDAVIDNEAVAGLILDEQYHHFTLELLRQATQSIKIIMFYMRYDKRGEESPNDQLVEAVLSAKDRGIDIKVILDRDRQGDVFKSRLINNNAFKVLKQAGIDVIFDEAGQVTHTKLVLVDDSHVIVGSHNWTTGSLSTYDDTSLYVKSKSVSENYTLEFNQRFEKIKAPGG